MATRKRPKRSEQKPAIEIIVEVPEGIKRAKMDQMILAAMRHVSTDALNAEELIVLQVQHNGNKPRRPPITKPPKKKV
jgi:hypothetical protein